MKNFFLSLLLFSLLSATAFAAGEPVEISAAGSLTWNRKNMTYVAKDAVVAKQGAAEIHSDVLTAFYTGDNGGTDISKLEAGGAVVIKSPPYTATGDRASYDVASGNAVLTGKSLKIETETDHLTARDKIEYAAQEDRLTAIGDATAVKEGKTLRADSLSAFFGKDSTGKRITKKISAQGNVSLKTEKETVTAQNGVYDIAAQKAVLTGKVRIFQGESWLEGTRAVVDMRTGISQLFAEDDKTTGGRVKGMFYPKTQPQEKAP